MGLRGIAAIGECMLELSGGDGDLWRMGHAGDTFNTLWALRALAEGSGPFDYVSAFGDDPFSGHQVAFFAEHGIGIAASPSIAGARPGLYAITLDGAERSFTYWRSEAAARRLADKPDRLAKSLQNRQLVYFSGITLAILEDEARQTLLSAIGTARQAGSRVAFDPNYRPRLWPSPQAARAAVDAALAVTDIALPTFPDEAALFGDASASDTAARLAAAGVGEIAIKNGEDDAFIFAGGRGQAVAAVSVASPVDTTGAGDAFNGAYLAARLAGEEPVAAAGRAHRVAGGAVQFHGALAPFDILRRAYGAVGVTPFAG